VKRTIPLTIRCQRPSCGAVVEVPHPSYQREQKYCGLKCKYLAQRGRRPKPARFHVCQNPRCGRVTDITYDKPSKQRRRKFCSNACSNVHNINVKSGWRLGLQKSVQTRKRRVLERVAGLDPVAAFKVGYRCGLESKCRQIRRRYELKRRVA